jgi:hypothetical protein
MYVIREEGYSRVMDYPYKKGSSAKVYLDSENSQWLGASG